MKLLVSQGASVNHHAKYDKSAVLRAAQHDRLDVVEFLLEKGADIDGREKSPYSTESCKTFLAWLVRDESPSSDANDQKVAALLQKYVFAEPGRRVLERSDGEGGCLLHYFAGRGMRSCVQALLEFGIPLNQLRPKYTTKPEGGVEKKVRWYVTPLDVALEARNRRPGSRFSKQEIRELCHEDDCIIVALKNAGAMLAPASMRSQKEFCFGSFDGSQEHTGKPLGSCKISSVPNSLAQPSSSLELGQGNR